MPEFSSIDPESIGAGPLYDLLVGAVQPRPIALVSTLGPDGRPNLAPFSFFMVGGVNPPSLAFSATNTPGGPKDSLRNAVDCGEFVVNTVHRQMAEGMNASSFGYPSGVSEWAASGFTPMQSLRVRPPRVAESLVQFECKLFQVVAHGNGSGSANYVIGEVLQIHVAAEIWDGSRLRPGALRPIARMGGPNYLDTGAMELFEMQRPTSAAPESD